MKMRHGEALRILGLDGKATFEAIKLAYRKACSKYHPDRNAAGLEMMKVINCAWQSLSDYVEGSIKDDASGSEHINLDELSEEMNSALNAIIHLGLTIEICGTWIWVSGDTRPHKEALKAAGYFWASKKLMWHWRPAGSKSFSRGKYSMDEIRAHHGSVGVKGQAYVRIGG